MLVHKLPLSIKPSAKELKQNVQGKNCRIEEKIDDDHTWMRTNKRAIGNLSNSKQKKTGYNCYKTSK